MRTLDELRDLADATRFRLGLAPGRIDPFAALEALDVVVVRHRFGFNALDGAYARTPEGECFAVVNSTPIRSRQRFSAAHELAHHLLGGAGIFEDFPVSDVTDRWVPSLSPEDAEQEADFLASLLLMDGATISSEAARWNDPRERVLGVMARFTVSLPAAVRRLVLDGLIDPEQAPRLQRTRQLGDRMTRLGLDTSGLDRDEVDSVSGQFAEWADWLCEVGIITEVRRHEALGLVPLEQRRPITPPAGASEVDPQPRPRPIRGGHRAPAP